VCTQLINHTFSSHLTLPHAGAVLLIILFSFYPTGWSFH